MIQCKFYHTTPDLRKKIEKFLSVRCDWQENNNVISCSCSPTQAEQIRSTFADTFGDYPQLWLSIDDRLEKKNHLSYKSEKSIGKIEYIRFGALLSIEKYLVHQTDLNGRSQWTGKFLKDNTLQLECQNLSIRLNLHFNSTDRTVFVIDGSDYADLIFSFDYVTVSMQSNENSKTIPLYRNDPLVQSLSGSSDLLISMSSKEEANLFLDYLHQKATFQIFYTMISMEINKSVWSNDDFQYYPKGDARYGIAMLHALGYLFDDKYLRHTTLQRRMIHYANTNPYVFYQLTIEAQEKLKKFHYFDLTHIFNENQWQSALQSKSQNKEKSISVAMLHLTPTRLIFLPKEVTQGHRAMRRHSNENSDDYCQLDLKPDPPNKYLNSDRDLLKYFHDIFRSGIAIAGESFHFFGLSNNQLKNHSFWFRKATSMDDIHRLRNELGQLNRINNIGTYVSRLGLWFSKTDPTGIQLNFYANENEFLRRVAQREHCVTMIDDVEQNNYCFTDGNGLVSKGLAKLIAENLSIIPKNSTNDLKIPSAYQIRLAGCKGMIIIDPQSTYNQFYLKIRPSMKKFECNDWRLEVCGYSEPKTSRLNNQIIWLLSDLGVSDQVFFRLQQRWFASKPSRSKMIEALEKNQIPLKANECRYIYGCALESSLEEGQCFIRYQVLSEYGRPSAKPIFECVRGRVIVTKNPCPYAGDMLELWAVDRPELHDLHDVIVFSTRGERPDFNKIAGSDLDGDGYFVYWGEELRLSRKVRPLDYTPEEKKIQTKPISPDDIIEYCLSTIGATSYGEIYNIHATIVDLNLENHPQRTCQKLAMELAKMFSSAVDSGKTGYIVDRQRIQSIRTQYVEKYPDFLRRPVWQTYKSKSIVGRLYQNAVKYRYGKENEIEMIFSQLNLNDSTSSSVSSIGQPAASSTPLNRSFQLHPGSPISNFSTMTMMKKIPSQFVLIDGMNSISPPIRLIPSNKPFYSQHEDFIRVRLELLPTGISNAFISSSSLASLLFEQIAALKIPMKHRSTMKLSISFGYFYLLKDSKDQRILPKDLQTLINEYFLPSTIIEMTKKNEFSLQQIFYKSNHQIRDEYMESNDDRLQLIFPWFKMNFIEHRREILLICFDRRNQSEIFIHFDKNGRIQNIETSSQIFFKCFHQQSSLYRPDLLYECRSSTFENVQFRSQIFQHETLLDPTNPLTLPFHSHIVPMLSYSRIANIFEYEHIQVHIVRHYSPIHYKNNDYDPLLCTLAYFDEIEQQNSVEIHLPINEEKLLDQQKLRSMISLASELSQMLK